VPEQLRSLGMWTPSLDEASFARRVRAGENFIALSTTLQLDRATPITIYDRLRSESAFVLLESAAVAEETGRYSFIGLDRLWRVRSLRTGETTVRTADSETVDTTTPPLEIIQDLLAQYRTSTQENLPGLFAGAIGYIAYDYVRRLERLPRPDEGAVWPDLDFSFARSMVVVDHVRHSTTVIVGALVDQDGDAAYDLATQRLSHLAETLLAPNTPHNHAIEELVASAPQRKENIAIRSIAANLSNFHKEEYCAVVDRAKEHIRAGDIFQVVPSQQFKRPTKVDSLTLYRILRSLNPSPYMYLLDLEDAQLVGASPEMLVQVQDGVVHTRPIAGTRRRGDSHEADLALEADMLQDEKEIAEHMMLVDLGRNDVSRVAQTGTVRVDSLAKVERFSHLMHLVSQVSGRLREGSTSFDALDALFPAGTLSGAPKVRAMELIDSFEPVHRGPYGGAVGYFALNGDADFAITIRTVALRDGFATVQAGGGVVADSSPEFEYEECISKASAPLLALELADPSN
jgi:anthranilate synthase component I